MNPTRTQIMSAKPDAAAIASSGPAAAKPNPKAEMNAMLTAYLANRPGHEESSRKKSELELRFRGMNGAPLTKTDYENVASYLKSNNYKPVNMTGDNLLRIQPQYVDPKSGITKLSNIRAEITSTEFIQEYCQTNSLQHLLHLPVAPVIKRENLSFTQKTPVPVDSDAPMGAKIRPVDFGDLNFRVAYQYEQIYGPHGELVRGMISAKSWADSKKVYRHMNRVRFIAPDGYPLFVDLSILRTSPKSGNIMIPHYTVQDARLFSSQESYEIEIEVDNDRVESGKFGTPAALLAAIRKVARIIMSAIQGSNYPIGNAEHRAVQLNYLRMLHGEQYDAEKHRVLSRDFVGPSSMTLQVDNLASTSESNIPCILANYTATDKADGERKLMFISDGGKIYLIDTNMRVQFSGSITKEKKLFRSLFDGEHIKFGRTGSFINLYAIFDVYFVNKKSVREHPFIHIDDDAAEAEAPAAEAPAPPVTRWDIMNLTAEMIKPESGDPANDAPDEVAAIVEAARWQRVFSEKKQRYYYYNAARDATYWADELPAQVSYEINIDNAKIQSYTSRKRCALRIQTKKFYVASKQSSIFQCCDKILNSIYEYSTDGIIFTPASYGVGGNAEEPVGPLRKITWGLSFKWKPAKFNTIDFLVRVQKDEGGKDLVHTEFQSGVQMQSGGWGKNGEMQQYKTLILHCGYDEAVHGYYNPFEQLLKGEYKVASANLPTDDDVEAASKYMARPFIPSNPFDARASLCNVYGTTEGGNLSLRTEDGQVLEENTIVEFRYDVSRKGAWRWIPLRVRYDKTAQLAKSATQGGANQRAQIGANDYTTANNNWYSIHHPITDEMIATGNGVPQTDSIGEDVYYSRKSGDTTTRGLRDFHNLYVKSKLINGVAQRKDTLIDFSAGKAGDLAKWRTANLGFVLGVDISKDNIMNKTDGACVRYLNDVGRFPKLFDGIFLAGNSALNIRSGEAFASFKEKKIAQAVFGEGAKNREELGPIVYRNYGAAQEGFSISSCQFSLHYFFENLATLHNFARNVAECTRLGGLFIGTCWDGKKVFDLLKNKPEGGAFTMSSEDGRKMFQLTRMYGESGFPDDEMSLGYMVNVFQESIGHEIPEFLVNFDFFVRVMENYGLVLAEYEDTARMGLPGGTAMFESLFVEMEDEIRRNPRINYGAAALMSEEEKLISFLNRYFVFRKVRQVSTEKLAQLMHFGDAAPDTDALVESVATAFGKKKALATKAPATKAPATKAPATKAPATKHFIRRLGETSITIEQYVAVPDNDDDAQSGPQSGPEMGPQSGPEMGPQSGISEIRETPVSSAEPAITLKPAIAPPRIVRTNKKIVIPGKSANK